MGFINKKGEMIIKPIYDLVYGFQEGRVAVFKDNLSYFIDKKGNKRSDDFLMPLTDYNEGLALVMIYKDYTEKIEFPFATPDLPVKHLLLIDKEGKVLYKEFRFLSDIVYISVYEPLKADDFVTFDGENFHKELFKRKFKFKNGIAKVQKGEAKSYLEMISQRSSLWLCK